MTEHAIESVVERVKSRPLERQADAAQALLLIQKCGASPCELSPEDESALDEPEASGIATDEEIRAAFARFPRPLTWR